ncbi:MULTISPECIES: GNAT family N-acetyltransferase [unclassified Oceanobacter]|uniref:GNAT family N-acetyltransferase n=1 Tax=unclassified Oceanobacter TaxID=2620260 RepID=UPI0027336C69|nr:MULTISPECIES: GNAT family N-acetyltransferase [unclassified Oceanobacter]MDP2609133.1 GNAT family N-acetyltransferase [Oceanobacter sp. 1_MG-2023]MDP2612455.1 GNAT family N-acetyltransferase [Oceanobacter sp. 2_MG-2023]
MSVSLLYVSGVELQAWIDDLARLRIQVFREYPYLYQGSAAYERQYLQTYTGSGAAMAILAIDDCLPPGQQVVGASTGIPMGYEDAAFRQPFERAGMNTSRLFYCAESVLLPAYRGQGIYRGFFAGREKHARSQGCFDALCFCAVVRPPQHPLKPADYRPLDKVWQHFGYRPCPDLITHYDWQDIDQDAASAHPMMFWMKSL